jgi:predicted nucleotidyltransferase component of viral defense system
MTKSKPANAAASVLARLKNLARRDKVALEYLLNRYAAERLLVRLSLSRHRDRVALKGATLFRVWEGPQHRATRDVDLLSWGSSEPSAAEEFVREICAIEVEGDGIVFPPETIEASRIKEGDEYEGVRVKCRPRLGTAELLVQIDIGFGDDAELELAQYPTLLDGMPSAELRVYTRESVIAEKVHAMVHLDLANSRMKDFFDVHHLAANFAFDLDRLAHAVRATFARRSTDLPTALPLALTQEFGSDPIKTTQWQAFLRKTSLDAPELSQLVGRLAVFLALVRPQADRDALRPRLPHRAREQERRR